MGRDGEEWSRAECGAVRYATDVVERMGGRAMTMTITGIDGQARPCTAVESGVEIEIG